jgi:hypothetical protein
VMAAVSVVLPWSTCPMVPTLTWGFVLSNFAFAMKAFLLFFSKTPLQLTLVFHILN